MNIALVNETQNLISEGHSMSKTARSFEEFYEEKFEQIIIGSRKKRYFYNLKDRILTKKIQKDQRILDIGCGTGDLLSKLKPSFGVGVDLSAKMIKYAEEINGSANIKFLCGDIFSKQIQSQILADADQKFDVILLSGTVGQIHDVIALFKVLHQFSHSRTRIYVLTYSMLWQPLYKLADLLKIRIKPPTENWLPPEELKQMFYHADLQLINLTTHILFPFKIPVVSRFLNDVLAHLPFFEWLCMTNCFTLRPIGEKYNHLIKKNPTCSIVIPCRNEAGHIYEIIERLPDLGPGSEYIFVEGNSTDNTEEVIKKAIEEYSNKPFKFFKQSGVGKGDAVRCGFENSNGDILGILDADITVPPEDLTSFINVLIENKAEFVNGSRLVYPMEKNAMRFLNLLANKFFAFAFTYILGQPIRDTLCGTKVLWKVDYKNLIKNRSYFGDFDPFGDFDLIFGATKLNLKIIDLPVRYGERVYGETNISRFRHGLLLLRMTLFAYRKIKML